MEFFDSEMDNPNILDMDFRKFYHIRLILDNRDTREEFLKVLPKEIFSTDKYHLMETEGYRGDMSPGKWLLRYLGDLGGRVSDLIFWFEKINLERALILLKEEGPLEITEQPQPRITVNEGEIFHITCRASGYPHPQFQWIKDGEESLLEQEQVLSVRFAKLEDGGTYVCKVSKINVDGSISFLLSDAAEVIVLPRVPKLFSALSSQDPDQKHSTTINPDMINNQTNSEKHQEQNILATKCHESDKIIIEKQPRSHEKIAQGSVLCFKCIAKASHPVNYQWYRNGRKLDDQTSTKLVVDELFPDQETGSMKFQFFCEVYNEYDQVFSDIATVELSESNDKTKYVAEEKIAFLIANDKYAAYEEDLVTPAVDVIDLTKLLKAINFKVIPLRNLNLKDMKSAFQAFCKLLKVGSYAVVFFAGHGFECYGQTYLQPVDCSENFLPEESMCTEYILQQLQETKPALIVLLIDACRKSPPELGNSPIEIYHALMGRNTVYGYATSFLKGAYESNDRNSYFVKHLKKYIMHDKSIQEIIIQVQRDFDTEPLTRNLQHPVIKSSLCTARKLCDELRNPPDIIYQLPCWCYQKRNPIQEQTQIINELKCYFIIEIKDHMDVYLNGVDVNFYIHVDEDANLERLSKSGLVIILNIPDFKLLQGFQVKNAAFRLGAKTLIRKVEILGLQKMQNAEIKVHITYKYEQSPTIPIQFSVTVEKIKNMNMFFG